jgi:hypothetical protein
MAHDYLISGMLYCDCPRKWLIRANSYTRKNSRGSKVNRKSLYGTYYCSQVHKEVIHPDCPRTIGSNKADDYVWQKVCEVINNPEILIAGAQKYVDELKQKSADIATENERIQNELDAIIMERQWVITQARKGRITDSDMDYQLGALALQELNLKRELASSNEIFQSAILNNWDEKAREYLEDLRLGLEALNAAPQTEEERHELFLDKRRIVQTLIDRVHIGKNREIKVVFRLNILEIVRQADKISEVPRVETYTRTPVCPSHSHPSGSFWSPSPPACRSRPGLRPGR